MRPFITLLYGIFHGIDTYDHRKTRATTGFLRLIYNRVGVAITSTPQDERWMAYALVLARKAQTQGEVPVGAVVVKAGQIIGQGWNRSIAGHDPSAHAEMLALRDAGQSIGNYRLNDTSLYVTLEPCVMCTGALMHARVARVIYGAADPKAGAAGSQFDLLTDERFNHRISVTAGVYADQCAEILKQFFKSKRIRTGNAENHN